MKKIFLTPILFFQLFFFSSWLFSQDDNYDAVYLSLIKEYTLNPDGSIDFRYIKVQKLQTYRAIHNLYGETFVVYSPGDQEIKINEAYTIMPDGKKIITPDNAFNIVLPGFAANASAYNSLREMVVTHTGLERGTIINLDYQIHSKVGFYPTLMGNELLAEPEPIKELVIRVKIPIGENLYYKTINTNIQPVKTSEKNFQTYIWKLNNIPAMSAEEAQQGNNELYPRLIFSTSDDRNKIYESIAAQEAFKYVISEKLKKELDIILPGNSGKLNNALKLQEKVVNDIRLYPIPHRLIGYKCRTPEQIWNDNGGTGLEKTVLLVAFLKAAGIEAEPITIIRTSFFNDKLGTVADIEDFAVKVDFKEEGTMYLSATNRNNQNLALSMPGRTLVSLKSDGKTTYSTTGNPTQNVTIQGRFICSSDPKMTGEVTVSLSGSSNPFLGLQRDKNKIKNGISGGISSGDIKDVQVTDFNTNKSFQTFVILADKPFKKDTLLYFFNIPSFSGGVDTWNIKTLTSKRETAYELPAQAEEKYNFEISLPDGLVVLSPKTNINISNKAGYFVFEIIPSNRKLIIKREMQLRKRIIDPGIYQDFKKIFDAWNNPRNREIIFKTNK